MANEDNEEKTYVIPLNYTDSGRVLYGMLSTRNAVEAGLLAVFGWILASYILPAYIDAMTSYIVVISIGVPACAVALIGIRGRSCTEFISTYLRYRKTKRKYFFKPVNIKEYWGPIDKDTRGAGLKSIIERGKSLASFGKKRG